MVRHKLVTDYLKILTLSPSSAQPIRAFDLSVSSLCRRVRGIKDSHCVGFSKAMLGVTLCVLRDFLNVLKF